MTPKLMSASSLAGAEIEASLCIADTDGIRTSAKFYAEMALRLLAHVAALEERPITLKFTRCVWCGIQRDVPDGETHEQALKIATEHAWECTTNPLRQQLAGVSFERDSLLKECAKLRISRDTFRELAEQVHTTIGTVTTEFERLTAALESSVRNQVATAERRAFRAGAQWSETAPLGARDIDTAVAAYVAAGDRHGPIA